MNKKNLIIFVLVFLIVAALGFGIYFLLAGGGQSNANNTSYTLSVNENDQNISATLTSGSQTTQLSETALNQYAVVSLNSTSDIMWFECPKGYALTNPHSTTGNQATQVPLLSEVNIGLATGTQNNLTVTCNKNP